MLAETITRSTARPEGALIALTLDVEGRVVSYQLSPWAAAEMARALFEALAEDAARIEQAGRQSDCE